MNLKKKNHGLLNTTTVREINERIISEAVKININKLITGIKIWVVLGNGGERGVFLFNQNYSSNFYYKNISLFIILHVIQNKIKKKYLNFFC